MSVPPHGAVTFLFTDVEGSSTLWEHHPDAMQPAIARHDAILRRAVLDHHGYVVKMRGDGIHAAFASPTNALHAALAAQHALMAEQWPQTGALKVRAALHTANADERDGDYFGPDVNRAARLSAAAHGGQILLSAATQELVHTDLPAGVTLRDMGLHRLKDLVRPERIYQVIADSLPSDFPPLVTLSTRPNVLPIQLTPFIGRAKEMADCLALLRRRDVRLLTLTGPGGSGKTRLGLQIAADLLDTFSHGVFFVDLSVVHDPAAVPLAIARVLQIPDIAGVDPMTALTAFLREKQLLLVLDNCEQVLPAGVAVSQLLTACDGLKALATSRAPLHLIVEHEYPVPPLAVPDVKQLPPLPVLAQVESVQLFVERSTAVKPSFQVTAASAPAVAAICVRLDGLPLAIELAAARSRTLPPHDLLAQLSPSLPTLTGGFYDLPTRHQALRSTIAWSYALLSNDEQRVFRRLGVFAGGWTAQAAAAVCAGPSGKAPRNDEMLSILYSLADQSLIRRYEQQDGALRFTMLETVREYALERMQESGELAETQERHAQHFAALAEEAERHVFPHEEVAWFDRVQSELDNLRAVWRWSADNDRAAVGLSSLAATNQIASLRGWVAEWKHWYETLLALPSGQAPCRARLRALIRLAGATFAYAGYMDRSIDMCNEAVGLARAIGDTAEEALAQSYIGGRLCHVDLERGREFLAQAKATALKGSTPEVHLGILTVDLNVLVTFSHDPAGAEAMAEAVLPEMRAAGSLYQEALVLMCLGGNAGKHLKDPALALRYYGEAGSILEKLGARHMIDGDMHWTCAAYMALGDVAMCEKVAMETYERLCAYGDSFRPAILLRWGGAAALARGDLATARDRLERTLDMLAGRDSWWAELPVRHSLIMTERRSGNRAAELVHLRAYLRICRDHMRLPGSDVIPLWLARPALAERDVQRAAQLLAAECTLRSKADIAPLTAAIAQETAEYEQRLRRELGDVAFEQAWAEGAAMTRDQALDCALAVLSDASAACEPPPAP